MAVTFPQPMQRLAPLGGPLVGREVELGRLRQAWAGARAGRCRLVLLAGEAGVGKTRLAAELAGEVGVTLVVPGGMRTKFFDDRDPQYKPGPDAILNDPANVAAAIWFALNQPAGCAVREMVICAEQETSYP